MNNVLKAHVSLLIVNLIYGANYVLAKDIMPGYIQPNALIFFRVAGATCLFWIIRLFFWEKVTKKDLGLIAICALFGVALNQLFFFNGLNLTSPLNASIIMISNPIMVVALSFFILKEKILPLKVVGILTGTGGALWLILMGMSDVHSHHSALGDFYIFLNALTYALFLVLAKPLMLKYKPITVITLIFTFGLIYVSLFPPVWQEMSSINFSVIPMYVWIEITYVIVAVTFLAYLLNIFALKIVSPSVSSSYIYLQPLFAGVLTYFFSIWGLADYTGDFSISKIFCALLIAFGVFLISYSSRRAAKKLNKEKMKIVD